MTNPAAYRPRPLPPLDANQPICDPQTGLPTPQFILAYEAFRKRFNGSNRLIPCAASTASNVITLTPNDATPLLEGVQDTTVSIEGYRNYDVFTFEADATTDGSVTATVVPNTGSLNTIKVYINDGATQAGSGDIVDGSLYMLIFLDSLDSAAGGFVVK